MTVNACAKSVRRQESIRRPPATVAYCDGIDSGLGENAKRLKGERAAKQATKKLSCSFSGKNEFFDGHATGHLTVCFKQPSQKVSTLILTRASAE
jgi:hypothetical protein